MHTYYLINKGALAEGIPNSLYSLAVEIWREGIASYHIPKNHTHYSKMYVPYILHHENY